MGKYNVELRPGLLGCKDQGTLLCLIAIKRRRSLFPNQLSLAEITEKEQCVYLQ